MSLLCIFGHKWRGHIRAIWELPAAEATLEIRVCSRCGLVNPDDAGAARLMLGEPTRFTPPAARRGEE